MEYEGLQTGKGGSDVWVEIVGRMQWPLPGLVDTGAGKAHLSPKGFLATVGVCLRLDSLERMERLCTAGF